MPSYFPSIPSFFVSPGFTHDLKHFFLNDIGRVKSVTIPPSCFHHCTTSTGHWQERPPASRGLRPIKKVICSFRSRHNIKKILRCARKDDSFDHESVNGNIFVSRSAAEVNRFAYISKTDSESKSMFFRLRLSVCFPYYGLYIRQAKKAPMKSGSGFVCAT